MVSGQQVRLTHQAPAPALDLKQVGIDAVSHRHGRHRDARLLRCLHCLRLELGAVNSPTAAWQCLVHSAYVPIKSLMDTSILGQAKRINMTCQDAYGYGSRPRVRAVVKRSPTRREPSRGGSTAAVLRTADVRACTSPSVQRLLGGSQRE
jgi:hypothetical protein